MNCSSPHGSRGFALGAEATGAPEGATMSERVYDLTITALVGGLIWLLVSAVGLR